MSVVIPVYNQPTYLAEAIDSALGQTYRDFEVLVVDDGSTDDTPRVIASYGSRIRPLRKANGGFSSALNLGIREARGEWIAWLSSDDFWEPEKLERQMGVLRERPVVGILFTDFVKIDPTGRVLNRVDAPNVSTPRARVRNLLRGCYINGSSALIHRDVFQDVGLFDEGDRLASDLEMWLRIVPRYPLVHVPEPLVRYRVHPGQASTKVEALERATNRVLVRALRRAGMSRGAAGAALCLRDRVLSLPWRIRKYGRGGSGAWRVVRFYVGDFLTALVGR